VTRPHPDPSLPLDVLLTPERASPHAWGFTLPDGWQQGRGAFGGLVVGALVRAVEAAVGSGERALRSLTAELCGATQPGEAVVRTDVLRAGKGVSTVAARLEQGGEVQAHAVAVMGRARATDFDTNLLPPPAPERWQDCPVLPIGPPMGPQFARYFEFRSSGPLPFSGVQTDRVQGWIRPRSEPARRDAAWVVACVDAWWPVFYANTGAPRPMATIAFTFQLLREPATLDPCAPLRHVARTIAGNQGYIVEFRELWTDTGALVALNQQTIAVIR